MADSPAIVQSDYGTAWVVKPVGEFDLSVVDLLRDTFLHGVSAERNRVVVDLSATAFLDSVALGALIGAGRRAREWGGYVRLVAPRPNIRKVLALTGLDTVFAMYDTVDQAVTHEPASDVSAPA